MCVIIICISIFSYLDDKSCEVIVPLLGAKCHVFLGGMTLYFNHAHARGGGGGASSDYSYDKPNNSNNHNYEGHDYNYDYDYEDGHDHQLNAATATAIAAATGTTADTTTNTATDTTTHIITEYESEAILVEVKSIVLTIIENAMNNGDIGMTFEEVLGISFIEERPTSQDHDTDSANENNTNSTGTGSGTDTRTGITLSQELSLYGKLLIVGFSSAAISGTAFVIYHRIKVFQS